MRTIILVCLVCVVSLPLAAQGFGQVGTSGAQLFKINLDPRSSGLGYASASVVDNAAAVFTNVAGIEHIGTADVAFAYSPWFADIKIASVVAAYRLPDIGVFALQATGFQTDEEITTVAQENGTGQRYSISNLVLGLSFARHISDRLIVGIQAKYIRESYYNHSTAGLGFDLGSCYELGFSRARLSLVLQNFGADMPALSGQYADYSDSYLSKSFNGVPLPVTFRASFTMEPLAMEDYRVRLIADLVHPNDNVEHYNVGTEVTMFDMVSVRGGIKVNYDDESFALGIGLLGKALLGENIRMDYSFENFRTLSSIHKIAFGFALQ
jgi:hypothetical protein